MTAVGFIGPGVMGAPMIKNLVDAGHEVIALGRSDSSVRRIAASGATAATDIRDLASNASTVITMLPDSSDVEAVMFDDNGLAKLLTPSQLFVDMSTISPLVSRRIHENLNGADVPAVDAPVSGGEHAAVNGTLSVMAGGHKEAFDACEPLLASMATSVTYVGPPGSGQLTKAANQLIVAGNLQALAEAIVFLEGTGVELEAALDAISGGLAGSRVLDQKKHGFLTSSFEPGFRVSLHNKDLGIVLQTITEKQMALPIAALTAQLMASLNAQGGGSLDHSALLSLSRVLNGRPDYK